MEGALSAASISNGALKKKNLFTASVQLDLLKLHLRLAKDCNCITNKDYLTLQSKLHTIGKMLGGWIKSL